MAKLDMLSSSPVRTPKLQLAAEQPSTGECWISPKKHTPRPRAKEKPQKDSRRGKITFGMKIKCKLVPRRTIHNLLLTKVS